MQFRRHPLASAVALSVLLSPLAAQQDWVEWDSASGTTPGEQYGFAMTGLGDWNMDGFDDYLVTSPGASANALNAGMVTVHSGQDGSVLTTLDGMAVSDQLGFAVANLGEHGDGLPKVAIGAPFQSSINGAFTGLVRVYAWDNLAGSALLLQEIAGPMPGAMFGLALAASDLDGDGDLDLVVANSSLSVPTANSGELYLNQGGLQGGIEGVFFEVPGSAFEDATDSGLKLGVTTGDLDADGDIDVGFAVHDLGGGSTQPLYLNQGGAQGGVEGQFVYASWFDPGDFISGEMFLIDADRDGDLDVLQAGGGDLFGFDPTSSDLKFYLNVAQ